MTRASSFALRGICMCLACPLSAATDEELRICRVSSGFSSRNILEQLKDNGTRFVIRRTTGVLFGKWKHDVKRKAAWCIASTTPSVISSPQPGGDGDLVFTGPNGRTRDRKRVRVHLNQRVAPVAGNS